MPPFAEAEGPASLRLIVRLAPTRHDAHLDCPCRERGRDARPAASDWSRPGLTAVRSVRRGEPPGDGANPWVRPGHLRDHDADPVRAHERHVLGTDSAG